MNQKDDKGRVSPDIAADKVLAVIDSCKDKHHLEAARVMTNSLIRIYTLNELGDYPSYIALKLTDKTIEIIALEDVMV